MEQINNEDRKMLQDVKNQIRLLDSYFENRHNSEGKDSHGRSYILERKTTLDIVDELNDMLELPQKTVFDYLYKKGYRLGAQGGCLKWKIYREVGDTIE